MTIWTLRQVAQARGLYSRGGIAPELVERPGAMEAMREKLAKTLIRHAHPFAIEIHPGDLRFKEEPGEKEWLPIIVQCWWEPRTEEVELRGGSADGMVMAVRDAPNGSVLIPAPSPPVWALNESPGPAEPLPRNIRYDCAGWNESERRWVYDVQGPM